jgi:hypothetical protein
MERRWNEMALDDALDLDDLLHPAQAFDHPSDVVDDPDLTLNEKRAILASWASDACAIEAAPGLRRVPGGKSPVLFDDVMDALRALDRQAHQQQGAPRRAKGLNRQRFNKRSGPRDGGDGHGHPLN